MTKEKILQIDIDRFHSEAVGLANFFDGVADAHKLHFKVLGTLDRVKSEGEKLTANIKFIKDWLKFPNSANKSIISSYNNSNMKSIKKGDQFGSANSRLSKQSEALCQNLNNEKKKSYFKEFYLALEKLWVPCPS